MRVLYLVLSLFLSAHAFAANVVPDIIIKSRFDLESSQAFINELRKFLSNNNFGDPYSQEIKKPFVFDLADAIEEVPEDTQRWIRDLQSVLQINVFESDYKVTIERLSYSIDNFNTQLIPGQSTDQRVEYVTVGYVKGLRLKAERIVFGVELKQTQTREPIRFKVELICPEFLVSPQLVAEMSMGWSTSILSENIQLNLEAIDIEKLMKQIVKRPDLIDIRVKDMIMPDASVKIGHKEVTIDKSRVKNFFIRQKDEMKKGILDLLNLRMEERFSNIIKDNPKKLLLPRTHGIQGDVTGVFDMQGMTVNRTGIVEFNFAGHFCNSLNDLVEDLCRDRRISTKLRRSIEYSTYQKSVREMNRKLIEKKTNIGVSISEHYLNQVIESAIRSGMLDEALKGNDFKIGPEKAFVLAEEKGDFSLFLDIIYPLKKSERILVGRSELHFPVKLMIRLKVEDVDGIPHLTLKVNKIATDEKLILEGAPQYDLQTTVNTVPRFRNKVVSKILEDVSRFENKTLFDIPVKELKGTYLDQLEFYSDGQGRAAATIGFRKLENL